jgi:hypothetical protein
LVVVWATSLNYDLAADQWLAAPLLGDVGEHALFDFVPLASAARKVGDVDGYAHQVREAL